jgi:hypothetical protein
MDTCDALRDRGDLKHHAEESPSSIAVNLSRRWAMTIRHCQIPPSVRTRLAMSNSLNTSMATDSLRKTRCPLGESTI